MTLVDVHFHAFKFLEQHPRRRNSKTPLGRTSRKGR
jgi:hypothetical protein